MSPDADAETFNKVANLLNILKLVGRSESSHPFMASLYTPLAVGDLAEGVHQRREGRSGMLPILGGLALAAMAGPHLADPLAKFMQKRKLDSASSLAKFLVGKLTPGSKAVGGI